MPRELDCEFQNNTINFLVMYFSANFLERNPRRLYLTRTFLGLRSSCHLPTSSTLSQFLSCPHDRKLSLNLMNRIKSGCSLELMESFLFILHPANLLVGCFYLVGAVPLRPSFKNNLYFLYRKFTLNML